MKKGNAMSRRAPDQLAKARFLMRAILGAAIAWQLSTAVCCAQPAPRHSHLFTMNVDGSNTRPVVAIEGMVWHGTPCYSPDGERLVFDASPQVYGGPPSRIYTVRLDDQRKSIADLGYGANGSWSADGKQIAFFIQRGSPGGEKPGVYTMNVDGTNRKWHSEGEKARFSPIDNRILFMSRHEGFPSIYVIDGDNRKRVLFDKYSNVTSGSWSPDGTQIVYIAHRNNEPAILGVTPSSGKEVPPRVRFQGRVGWIPSWSPDGKQIVLWKVNERNQQRISLITFAGNNSPVEIPGQEFTSFNSDPSWSPDGRRIAFCSDRIKQ